MIANGFCHVDEVSTSGLSDCKGIAEPEDDTTITSMELLLRKHSGCQGPWRLGASPLGGRGLFLTKPLPAGSLVLRDPAIVLAPRNSSGVAASVCVRCLSRAETTKLKACYQCGLPVCCDVRGQHDTECNMLQKWNVAVENDAGVADLVKASAAIRCLAIQEEERRIVLAMQTHDHPRHGQEVDALLALTRLRPSGEAEQFMRHACRVMDANAFEVNASVRGLYPLSAMMNHACTPNTTHGYDATHAMVVRTTTPLPEGAELTTSYAPLLWGTPARRRHLAVTKHFLCSCPRCQDPEEGGACLSALLCGSPDCGGVMLSASSLNASAPWNCQACGFRISSKQAAVVQVALGSLLTAVDLSNPREVHTFLLQQRALGPSNHVAVDLKCSLIWNFGHSPGFTWAELSEEDLLYKEKLCEEILRVLELLGAGQCRLRGLLLYELFCTLIERYCRKPNKNTEITKEMEKETYKFLTEAAAIFDGDVTANPDLWRRVAEMRSINGDV